MDKVYMGLVAELGCIVCRNMGFPDSPAEVHHIKSGVGMGQKSSNFDVIPLCPVHHRNGDYGTAYHRGPKEFEKRYGTELKLLEQTKELLNEQNAKS